MMPPIPFAAFLRHTCAVAGRGTRSVLLLAVQSVGGPIFAATAIWLLLPVAYSPAGEGTEFDGQRSEDSEPELNVSIAEFHRLPCNDCDGLAMADLTGNGRVDLLMSNGKGGETFWYEQGDTPQNWTRHTIHTIDSPRREIEGNDLGDFNGDGRMEAVSLDQKNGVIYLHVQGDDPRGAWRTSAIVKDRPLLQASLVTDIDGDGRSDLVFTWEGDAKGRGGVHWLRLDGDDPLEPTHWSEHVMVVHESAWWLAARRVDLSGDGRDVEIVFSARNIKSRNPGARPGVFWLQPPADVTQTWTRHTIDDSLDHPLHVDLGDFSGDGHGKDVVVGGFNTEQVHWYRFADDWRRYSLQVPLVDGVQPDRVWNVKTARLGGTRDGILAPVCRGPRGALVYFEFTGERHEANVLRKIDYGHPMDDRILLHDIDGNGMEEAFLPDSGTGNSSFVWIRFQRRPDR